MKGIILAGGTGSRLFPTTSGVSKSLLPVYDVPVIYYSLDTLIKSKIKDILIISTPFDTPYIKHLLRDGSQFGVNLTYRIQNSPRGIAEAFLLGKDFIKDDSCTLILSDNVFIGDEVIEYITNYDSTQNKALIFGYKVEDPERFGVIEFKDNQVISIEEKPKNPKSNYCVTGLYIYPEDVVNKAKKLEPSLRNELEITDLNCFYLYESRLNVKLLKNTFWIDVGTPESFLEASNTVKNIERIDKKIIACPEESAYTNGWISFEQLRESAYKLKNSNYGKYLIKGIEDGKFHI